MWQLPRIRLSLCIRYSEISPCKYTAPSISLSISVGDFQSEALLVPQGCRFGHVDDRQTCEEFGHWERVGHDECAKRNGGMNLRSFAMLAPCGLDMYSGVEFVCCPLPDGPRPEETTAAAAAAEAEAKPKISATLEQGWQKTDGIVLSSNKIYDL